MIPYPKIDPILLNLGPVAVRWYGMMYILGFTATYFILKHRVKETGVRLAETDIGDLVVALIFGLLIGGRLGYCLFYNPVYYIGHPLELLAFWSGGMSFHGGLIGAILAGFMFCKRRGIDFYHLADTGIVAAPIGLGLGRLGNFINAELYGRASNVPWAMVFPTDPLQVPRHPSQLYEAGLEGVVLAIVLWTARTMNLARGSLFWLFICLYGVFRTFSEFFREPDAHLAFIFPGVTAGMIVSLPMIFIGGAMLVRLARRGAVAEEARSAA